MPPEFLVYASDFPPHHGDGGARPPDALDPGASTAVLSGNARSWYRDLAG